LTRRFCPLAATSRSRSACGLKSTPERAPPSNGVVSVLTVVAAPVAGSIV